MVSDAELIAKFIAEKGVTKCPDGDGTILMQLDERRRRVLAVLSEGKNLRVSGRRKSHAAAAYHGRTERNLHNKLMRMKHRRKQPA